MYLPPRHSEILQMAKDHGRVLVDGLASHFGVTPQTIRKDLNELCEQHLLTRIHGGGLFPAGIGNLEEVVELLSWKRVDLHHKPVVFLNLNGFWNGFFDLMKHSVAEGMTPPSFLDAWTVAETVEEAMAQVQAGGDAPQLKHDHR